MYCDFCDCKDCQNGTEMISHAQTASGNWICDVCYTYEVCLDAKTDKCEKAPCSANEYCKHRPILIGPWSK